MIQYLAQTKAIISKYSKFEVELIPREQNTQADALSKLASSSLTELNKSIFVEVHQKRSIESIAEVNSLTMEPSWMDPIVAYKLRGKLPEDRNEAAKLKRIGSRFIIYNEDLLRKSFSHPLLKCVGPTDAN